MKKYLIILLIIISFFSCKKKEDDTEYKDIMGDIIYSDSFAPAEWENPVDRQKVEELDKDIGKFIKADVVDPKLRNLIKTVNTFINLVNSNNIKEIEKTLTPSAFNSFKLRMPQITIKEKYQIRTAYPDYLNADEEKNIQNQTENKFWVNIKILYQSVNIVTKFEFEYKNNSYVISDFDNNFFNDLKNNFSKKK